jgi:stringent starvation protein B
MASGPISDNQGTSTRPYLLRALHDWCTDNGFTPYIAVFVDDSVQVPMEYVKNNEIVLNVGFEATSALKLGNEFVEFKARFGGSARDILVPIDHVVAIYARENGQGMAFPVPADSGAGKADAVGKVPAAPRGLRLASSGPDAAENTAAGDDPPPDDPPPDPAGGGGRPSLKRVK